ncbi:hypothetical protein ACFOZ0_31345 [Streptomyces yaanensis]|uniref:Secreted protein n=1 Tax=Streptomyces yaanensis TaxID=1142239 RepID=A0ABV7SL09_9ACTN|nr:hypothetical protein [Streptomyces sp. CGMCC 4.7035]WNC01967.1 hypothetical protein Q2K21_30065 [Streptomyces sp. CGMCC 4.7035]
MKRAIAAGAFALVSAATCLVLAPTASAAPNACVTSTLTTGGYEGVGTIVRKSSTSSCGDLNLTYSDDSTSPYGDYYAGRLRNSSGVWHTCSKGYVWASDGSHSVNDSTYWLCTDVNDNTPFTVASQLDGGDTVRITH